jgi:hypothetical protein
MNFISAFIIVCQNKSSKRAIPSWWGTVEVKMVFSFIAGVVACSMLIFGVNLVLPVFADTDNSASATENTTNSLTKLIPDIEKIYTEALTYPFIKAESKIYDKDIAEYYRGLMDRTGLAPSR